MNKKWWCLLFVAGLLLTACQQQRDAYNAVEQVMEQTVADDGPGVVLLVQGPQIGQQIFARGLADREKRTDIRTVSHFRIGGLTKAFISTLVLQLVAEGKLSLDDTVAQRLPQLAADIPHSEQITLAHLLNMTSGLPDYRDNPAFWQMVQAREKRNWQPEEVLPYALQLPSVAKPGAGFHYANTNTILLQLILASVLEEHDLTEALQDRIFDPVDMPDTYMEPIAITTGGHVSGYADVDEDGIIESTLPYDDGRGLADLGLVSNALDLAAFAPALYERTLPGADGRALSLATVPMGHGDEYGWGIMRRPSDWGEMWGYASTASGFTSQMWYLPASEMTVVVLISGEETALADDLVQKALTAVAPIASPPQTSVP